MLFTRKSNDNVATVIFELCLSVAAILGEVNVNYFEVRFLLPYFYTDPDFNCLDREVVENKMAHSN